MPVDCTQKSLPCAFWCDIDRGKKWRERDGLPSPFALKMGGVKYIFKKEGGKEKKTPLNILEVDRPVADVGICNAATLCGR